MSDLTPRTSAFTLREVPARDEVIRIDAEGFHYLGQFIADAGEAYQLLVESLRKHRQEPADGEVAELVEGLRLISDGMSAMNHDSDSWFVARAAELLQRQAPQPVSVHERLPGPEDCDAEGRCWVHQPHEACPESPAWELMLAKYASANYEAVCWLPAHALPLPEVGNG